MKSIIIGILFFSSSVIHAQSYLNQASCTSTDIRETNPKIKNSETLKKHFSTPRNQDTIGWCYAFAASDFLTAEIGTPVSALHASIIYNSRTYQSPDRRTDAENYLKSNGTFKEVYESGWSSNAVTDIQNNGWVCTEESLPFDVDRPYDIKALIDFLESKKHLAESGYYRNTLCHEVSQQLEEYALTSDDVNQIVDSMARQNLNETLEVFANKACKDRIQPIPKINVKWVDQNQHTPTQLLEKINNELNNGSPVQLSYQPKYVTTSTGDFYHASMVIGRRWNNGRCEYNVRNSWGKLCATYKQGIDCNKEEGSFWMSEGDLIRSSAGFYHVQK